MRLPTLEEATKGWPRASIQYMIRAEEVRINDAQATIAEQRRIAADAHRTIGRLSRILDREGK